MAITRARLSFQVPWRREPDAPAAPEAQITVATAAVPDARVTPVTPGDAFAPEAMATPVTPAVAPLPDPAAFTEAAATGEHVPPGRQRGPDGRFLRRPAAPAAVPTMPAPVAPRLVVVEVGPGTDDPGTAQGRSVVGEEASTTLFPPAADHARLEDDVLGPRAIRVILVEDVPDVAVHVRELLRSQPRFRLIHVISDGRRAVDEIRDLHPDVVLVDSLLQGRVSARNVVEGLRERGSPIGIVALTVPDHPVDAAMLKHADAVVTLPLGTWDLGKGIVDAHEASAARDPSASSRIVAIFSAKGGVGKTTIAYNLAVSLASTGLRTLLLDGCLQFGDVRRLLRADPTAPSICDLPTDFLRGSDLADTVVRDPSGVEILLAPARPELAELVNGRDLEQLLGVLRRAYQAIVIDTPATLSEPTLAFLDAADLIVDVMTAEAVALDVTPMIAATFAELGYPAGKLRYLVNRFDAMGAIPTAELARAIGREPDYTVASDWRLVSASNAEGVPYVLARPAAAVSADLRRLAEGVRALAVTRGEPVTVRRQAWGH
jgi:pilus assembly protein CpaE